MPEVNLRGIVHRLGVTSRQDAWVGNTIAYFYCPHRICYLCNLGCPSG